PRKRTSARGHVRFTPKADMCSAVADVCFGPKADIRLPAIYQWRSFPAAGGLMSYGSDILDSYRLAGVHTGSVLKSEKPAELPVVQATKFELVINLKNAKALGTSVPPSMQARADQMIE